MADGDLVTQDWQMEYRDLLLGEGSPYSLVRVEGLLDLPGLVTSDIRRTRRHGALPGDDFLSTREVVITLEAWADGTPSDQSAVMGAISRVLRPGAPEAPLVFRFPGVAGGGKRRVNARVRKYAAPLDLEYLYGLPVVTIALEAMDPLIYDDTLSTGVTGLASAGGGLTFPEVPPLTFGALSTGGSISALNAGNADAPVVLRIDGPCTNPVVENVTTGRTLALNISLALGEFLILDSAATTVLLNGTANRYSTLTTPGWFALAPGVNELDFRAITPTAATLTATWRSAWVS